MEKATELYLKGIRKQTKIYFGQWFPNTVLDLGTVGELVDGYLFRPVTTLERLGVEFTVRPDPDPSPINLLSSSGAKIVTKLAGTVNPETPTIPQASAGIGVDLTREGAFVIKARETYEPRIEHLHEIEAAILRLRDTGVWQTRWAVVHQVVQAPFASIIVSVSSTSKLELTAVATADAGPVQLGDARVQLATTSESGTRVEFLDARNVTPLFQLLGLKRRFLGRRRPGFLGRDSGLATPALDFPDEVGEDEFYLDVITEP
jgi:hypothetical protein